MPKRKTGAHKSQAKKRLAAAQFLDLLNEDALRLVAQLRASEELRNLAILILIEEHEEEMLAKAFEVGVHDYLVRPIERSELLLDAMLKLVYATGGARPQRDCELGNWIAFCFPVL